MDKHLGVSVNLLTESDDDESENNNYVDIDEDEDDEDEEDDSTGNLYTDQDMKTRLDSLFKVAESGLAKKFSKHPTKLISFDKNKTTSNNNMFGCQSLAEACAGGNIELVKLLLKQGKNVHEATDQGESLLSLAASSGYLELCEVLLAMKVNVEDRGRKGDCTALMEAACAGHVDIIKLLLDHGADVNAKSSTGNTALHYAACNGHEKAVKLLIDMGAHVETHNDNGHTPLMEAASSGRLDATKVLLESGAGINTHSNDFKESALTLACYKGHLELVKYLLQCGADHEHKTDEMHTALMESSIDGHVEVARLLLDSGAQVNMPADSFESPLTLAACGGHVELANLLLERNANIEEANDEGYTPLMEAAREGHEEMCALLLAHGADINSQTEETQETPLTLACCGGFLEVADFLIKAGADIELGCSTPLMEACQEGHLEMVKYLLKSGANVHAKTQTGDTAFTFACENGHTETAEVLLSYGAELEHESDGGRTALMKAARSGHLSTVQMLINQGADVNKSTSNNDQTVLSGACVGGHIPIVELLLKNKANPAHKLKDGSTMLIEAAKGGHAQVVKFLLDWTTDMDNSSNDEAITTMQQSNDDSHLSQKSLVSIDAMMNINDQLSLTPLPMNEARFLWTGISSNNISNDGISFHPSDSHSNCYFTNNSSIIGQQPFLNLHLKSNSVPDSQFLYTPTYIKQASKDLNDSNPQTNNALFSALLAGNALSSSTSSCTTASPEQLKNIFSNVVKNLGLLSLPSDSHANESSDKSLTTPLSRCGTEGDVSENIETSPTFSTSSSLFPVIQAHANSSNLLLDESFLNSQQQKQQGGQHYMQEYFIPVNNFTQTDNSLGVQYFQVVQIPQENVMSIIENTSLNKENELKLHEEVKADENCPEDSNNSSSTSQPPNNDELAAPDLQLPASTIDNNSNSDQQEKLDPQHPSLQTSPPQDQHSSEVDKKKSWDATSSDASTCSDHASSINWPSSSQQQQQCTQQKTSLNVDQTPSQLWQQQFEQMLQWQQQQQIATQHFLQQQHHQQQQFAHLHKQQQQQLQLHTLNDDQLQQSCTRWHQLEDALTSKTLHTRKSLEVTKDTTTKTTPQLFKDSTARIDFNATFNNNNSKTSTIKMNDNSNNSVINGSIGNASNDTSSNSDNSCEQAVEFKFEKSPNMYSMANDNFKHLSTKNSTPTDSFNQNQVKSGRVFVRGHRKLPTLQQKQQLAAALASGSTYKSGDAIFQNFTNQNIMNQQLQHLPPSFSSFSSLAPTNKTLLSNVKQQLQSPQQNQLTLENIADNSSTSPSVVNAFSATNASTVISGTSNVFTSNLLQLNNNNNNTWQHQNQIDNSVLLQQLQQQRQLRQEQMKIAKPYSQFSMMNDPSILKHFQVHASMNPPCMYEQQQQQQLQPHQQQGSYLLPKCHAPTTDLQSSKHNQQYFVQDALRAQAYHYQLQSAQQLQLQHQQLQQQMKANEASFQNPIVIANSNNSLNSQELFHKQAQQFEQLMQVQHQFVPIDQSNQKNFAWNSCTQSNPGSSKYINNNIHGNVNNTQNQFFQLTNQQQQLLLQQQLNMQQQQQLLNLQGSFKSPFMLQPAIDALSASSPLSTENSAIFDINPLNVKCSIEVDAQTEGNHDTALTLACAGGHTELVELLLQCNANIEHRDKKGFSPIILAATGGHLSVVELLLDHNADIEAHSERTKDSALSSACSGGRYEVVELLLNRGANKEHRNVSDYTPLSLAASGGYDNIITLLLEHGAEINSRTGSKLGISPLMLAAMNGHVSTVKLLLDKGSDINAQIETNRNTALTLACFQGRHEVVAVLVDRRANIEHRAKTGLTPLMEAASGGYFEVGKVLLDRGADVNAAPVPSSRDTALTIAADKGHHKFVELLLSRKASVDVKNKKGNSSLWLACNGGHLEVVQHLVHAKADVDSQDNRKVSCLMAAFKKGHIKVVKWLVKHVIQFPSQQDCLRCISTIVDKDLLKRCQLCMEAIGHARENQAAEANRNANNLLLELDREKNLEEIRKAAAARKREKKKQKKKKKQNQDGYVKSDDISEDNKFENSSNDKVQETKIEVVVEDKKIVDETNVYKFKEADVKNEKKKETETVIENKDCVINHKNGQAKASSLSDSSKDDKFSKINKKSKKDKKNAKHLCKFNEDNNAVDDNTKDSVTIGQTEICENGKPSISPNSFAGSTHNSNGEYSFLKLACASYGTGIGDLDDFNDSKTITSSNDSKFAYSVTSKPKLLVDNNTFTSYQKVLTSPRKMSFPPMPKKFQKKDEGWKEVSRKCKKIIIQSKFISRIIGRGGCNINAIRDASGAHIDLDKVKNSTDGLITIKGSADAIKLACDLIEAMVNDSDKEIDQLISMFTKKNYISYTHPSFVGFEPSASVSTSVNANFIQNTRGAPVSKSCSTTSVSSASNHQPLDKGSAQNGTIKSHLHNKIIDKASTTDAWSLTKSTNLDNVKPLKSASGLNETLNSVNIVNSCSACKSSVDVLSTSSKTQSSKSNEDDGNFEEKSKQPSALSNSSISWANESKSAPQPENNSLETISTLLQKGNYSPFITGDDNVGTSFSDRVGGITDINQPFSSNTCETHVDIALQAKAPGYRPSINNSSSSPRKMPFGDVEAQNKTLKINTYPMNDEVRLPFIGSEGDNHIQMVLSSSEPSVTEPDVYYKNITKVVDASNFPINSSSIQVHRNEYASLKNPMTLPHIDSNLNPNAPDFTSKTSFDLDSAPMIVTGPQLPPYQLHSHSMPIMRASNYGLFNPTNMSTINRFPVDVKMPLFAHPVSQGTSKNFNPNTTPTITELIPESSNVCFEESMKTSSNSSSPNAEDRRSLQPIGTELRSKKQRIAGPPTSLPSSSNTQNNFNLIQNKNAVLNFNPSHTWQGSYHHGEIGNGDWRVGCGSLMPAGFMTESNSDSNGMIATRPSTYLPQVMNVRPPEIIRPHLDIISPLRPPVLTEIYDQPIHQPSAMPFKYSFTNGFLTQSVPNQYITNHSMIRSAGDNGWENIHRMKVNQNHGWNGVGWQHSQNY